MATNERTAHPPGAQKVISIPAKTPPPPIPIVAMVATDAGQTPLALEPMRIGVLRAACNNGEIHFELFIPLSPGHGEILRFCFDSNPRLKSFVKWLGIRPDTLLPETEFLRANLVAMLHELLERAGLLKLAAQPAPKLLLHDGLLRSIAPSRAGFSCHTLPHAGVHPRARAFARRRCQAFKGH